MIEAPYDIDLEIVNTRSNIGTTLADIERRQEINEVYSQGATNIDSHDYCDNADKDHPAVVYFYFPSEMVRVNKVELMYKTENFRTYSSVTKGGGSYVKGSTVQSKSTKSGGGVVKSSGAGGGTTATSSAGGGQTTSSGGGQTTSAGGGQTSSAGGDHTHRMFSGIGFAGNDEPNVSLRLLAANGHSIMVNSGSSGAVEYHTQGSSGNHSHTISNHTHTVSAHTHSVSNHTHSVKLDPHVHTINLDPHSHDFDVEIPGINIPDHTHEVQHGIYTLDRMPTKMTIKVDGNTVPINTLEGANIDLIPYLSLDSEGRVVRGWHTLEIMPDDLARITAQVTSQFFIQSRGGVDV